MQVINQSVFQITLPTPFSVGDTHVYLIKGDILSLVDAGVKTKEAWEALKVQLAEIGYTPQDIEQIILTHHHPDHTGLVEQFPRVEHIVAQEDVNIWLTKDEAYFQHYEQFFSSCFIKWGVPKSYHYYLDRLREPLALSGEGQLTKSLQEGDYLPGYEDWNVIDTKGHAQTHLSFFNEKQGLLIGGDHLLYHISPNPLLEAPYQHSLKRTKPLLQYRANVEKCLDLNIRQILPGHGPVFSDIKTQILKQRSKQEKRAQKVLQIIEETKQTPFEICKKLFPKHYETQLDLTMSETIGQLDYLEDLGLVFSAEQNGVCYYEKV